MSQLFSQYRIGRLALKNRIVIAPMCQYSAVDGAAGDWHRMHLGHLAVSGAGLLILEATAVAPEGRISNRDLGLWSDETEHALRQVVTSVRTFSDIPLAIQLGHAGRKASAQLPWEGGRRLPVSEGGWQVLAPSAVAYGPDEDAPLALDAAGLEQIRADFAAAARRAARLGFAAVELHGAHGYLLHQFLSPLSNHREDAYGGSLENRMRFPLEVMAEVRAAFPAERPVGIRISATDWVAGGWDLEQSLEFARRLRTLGCDFIHVSSGGLSPEQQIVLGSGYQLPFAERIRRETGMTTIGVGLITEPEEAEAAVAQGRADLVALGRAMLYDPRWPWHAAARLGASVEAPPQYWRCQPRGLKDLFKA
ncbi:NADH:flavin oxidoreductase/NADH oxidase [Paludibacterium yongneupense]|uniref:NADH:flavin oxidoreductase/NADH oxidase n=1 Tax=Paludibacterium yongneupense TaxID=400061 RepID=UPI0003F8B40F|nr:NADH:flavin oxidoreductase/NADH oxidase [Paludibacterium yongneupense]